MSGSVNFYGGGMCTIQQDYEGRYIDVENEGVREQNNILDQSLLLSFEPKGNIFFTRELIPYFWKWAIRYWAIDDNHALEDRSDGSWLLICPLALDVIRIRKIERVQYKDFIIRLNSRKTFDNHTMESLTWILVFNIPLHLKSFDLLKTIGNFCGSFIELDWDSGFLPYVRIRIKKSPSLPELILINHGSVIYHAKIMVPPPVV
ncbi:unnamed protein product [Linum trigynum]|uniref:DUF4283 domain-containing protein n=1 Tax=Linum trigynum TaxID=586398 RepID=A0AAV2FTK2_9ROSI